MQILPGIIQILNGTGSWAGSNGEHSEPPKITLALAARLVIDLRGADRVSPETADLAPYPFAEFADCVSWYIAIDSDYDQLTMPPIKRSTGISITQDAGGKTILAADLPILDSPEIRATVKTAGEIPLKGEIGALDASGNSVFVFDFPIILKNRVYIPGGGGDTPDPEDPEYLNTDQVQAFVISKLAEAIAELELPEGEAGPAPTLSIGTVTIGATASATVTSAGEGAYAINLVLPRATDGSTPEPITPEISIGTIQAGTEAAASLVPVAGTPGAFTLNLTLPRGADGSGVSPAGTWSTGVTYVLNAAVRHASAWWRSLHDDNLGNEPPATRVDNEHWEIIVKDGISPDPLVVNYNDTDDPDDAGWHLYRIATDRYYRFTTDGGLTFTEAMEISQAPLNVLILFNPDATTDWQDIPAPVGTNNYHIATGKYYRVKTDAGIWGTPHQIHALDASEIFRVQYGATPENEEDEPEWHANFQPGDDRILFYNTLGSIRLDIAVTLADGEEIGGVQLCSISNPWHATYAATDLYKKISVDSGLTWTVPILLNGKSAYQEWLDLGNEGTPQEFLNSLKGQDGQPGSGIQIDATGTLTERTNYDSTPLGFIYLASDGIDNGDGTFSPAMYQRISATQGVWSSAVPMTPGPAGKDGKDGAAGAAATIVPDFEFTSAEMLADIDHGNYLLIDGITPIAQVELYDTAGNGVAVERGDAPENGSCMIVTRYSQQKTIIYFGELDISRGGRVRFAQGSNSSGSSGGTALPITRQRFARPYFDAATHLVIQAGQALDFSDAETIIDTANVAADRAKVIGYTGLVLTPCPDTGFGGNFSGQPVFVDLSALTAAAILRYKWVSAAGDSDWYVTFFPSNGEAYVAPPASIGGETLPPYEPPPEEPLSGGLYILDGTTEHLLAESVEQVKVSGKFCVIDGKLYYKSGVTSIAQIGEETNWNDVSAYNSSSAVALNNAGEIHSVNISGTSKLGSASNWVKLSHGFCLSPAVKILVINSNGALYAVDGNSILLVDIGPGWTDVYGKWSWSVSETSFYFYGVKSGALYAIRAGLEGGGYFTTTRIGTESDWGAVTAGTSATSGVTNYPYAYAIKGPGHLYYVISSMAMRIGADADWEIVTGSSQYTGGTLAYAIKNGALYTLQGDTPTQVGSDEDWIAVQGRTYPGGEYLTAYGIRSGGTLYRILGSSVTQVGTSTGWTHVFVDEDNDLLESDLHFAIKEAQA